MRLRLKSDFERIKRVGQDRNAGVFIVSYRRREAALHGPRLGLVVSRRVGNAVVRNRVKRRLRTVFRQTAASLDPCGDYVIIARSAAAVTPYTELAQRFQRATAQPPKSSLHG